MKRFLALCAAVVVAGCSVTPPTQEVEAVRDFVAASGLVPLKEIPADRNAGGYRVLNDYFIIMPSRRKNYLVEFPRRCIELRETMDPYGTGRIPPNMIDVRRDSSLLRARVDTIRGCRIGAFYELTDEQVTELKNLGDAPGEEIFLPEKDDD